MLLCLLDESEGVLVGLDHSFVLPDPIGPPVHVEDDEGNASRIFVGNLIVPRFIGVRPHNFVVVGKLSLITLLEIFFPDLLLCLNGVVFVISPPVVEVIVVIP